MADKTYEGDGIAVRWRSERCIHTGICLRAAPEVFDTSARPWINLEGADPERVATAVRRCPTSALTYTAEVVEEETEPEETTMRPVRGGPMLVRGRVKVVDAKGGVICDDTRVALCRCGGSANQPFCDNSHRTKGFDEPHPTAPAAEPAAPDEVCPPQDFSGKD